MALPEVIGGVSPVSVGNYGGPFRSGGSVYHVHGASGSTIDVYKNTNPGTDSWAVQDGSNNPATNTHTRMWAVQNGTDIYIYSQQNGGSYPVYVHVFSMSSDTWTSTEGSVTTPSPTAGNGYIVAAHRSDGDEIVCYGGNSDKVHGTDYQRRDIAREEGSGWTADIDISNSTGDQAHHTQACVAMSGNDRFHVIWNNGSDIVLSSYLSGNTFGVQSDIVISGTGRNCFGLKGVSYDNGGTEEVRIPVTNGSEVYIVEFDDADNPSYTISADIGGGQSGSKNQCHLAVDANDRKYAVMITNSVSGAAADQDIHRNETGDGDDTWAGVTAEETTDFFNYILGANVYDNDDGDTVLAFTYAENVNATPVNYDEYVISSGVVYENLDGAIAASGDYAGELDTQPGLAGSLAGSGDYAGQLDGRVQFAAALAAAGSLAGSMDGQPSFIAALSGSSAGSALLANFTFLDGSLSATSTLAAELDTQAGLAAALAATGSFASQLDTQPGFSAALAAAGDLAATLDTQPGLAAALLSTASGAAEIDHRQNFAAALTVTAALAAELDGQPGFAAVIASTVTGDTDLDTRPGLAASLSALSAFAAELEGGEVISALGDLVLDDFSIYHLIVGDLGLYTLQVDDAQQYHLSMSDA